MSSFLLVTAPAHADFWDGLKAYDAGDYAEARDQWRLLAEGGDATAQTAFAGLYAQGLGVPFDPSRAATWFRRAAQQGDPIAQLNLGDYYVRGHGVPVDLVEAWKWLSLAARQGNRWAKKRRDEIERNMDGRALATAKRQLSAWRQKVR